MSKGEFGFIDFIKGHFEVPGGVIVPAGVKGIGDDCAVIPVNKESHISDALKCDEELLFSTDLLMEGVHFLREESFPEDIGWKAAAVNISDIAAMGGSPVATFLSIALPKDAQGEWAERFIKGYAEISRQFNVPLLGGDTTSSLRDIAINVGIMGKCPSGKSLCREGARVGDTIFVTGPLGDSAGGLQVILKGVERSTEEATLIERSVEEAALIERHKRPMPRIREGIALRETGLVSSMMDISDGIASDLRHILKASGVGAEVDLDRLPISKELSRVCPKYGWNELKLATGGGEDFELLFTAPEEIAAKVDFPIHPIGKIINGNSLRWLENDIQIDFNIEGYKHF